MNEPTPTRLQEKLTQIREGSKQAEQPAQDRQKESQDIAKSQAVEKSSGQKAADKLPAHARADLEKARQRLKGVKMESEKTSVAKDAGQGDQWTGNREHGKHVGNVIVPATTSVQPTTMEQKTAEPSKTTDETQAASKKQTLDKAKSIVAEAKAAQAKRDLSSESKTQDQQRSQKPAEKGRGR
jgi:hypothetical protein